MVSKDNRKDNRIKKHQRLRNRFSGNAERPRLSVFRSNSHMYAQIIDDDVIMPDKEKGAGPIYFSIILKKSGIIS